MKLNEKAVGWLKAELIVVLAVVLLLGVLFGYSLAMSQYSPLSLPGAVGAGESDVLSEEISGDINLTVDKEENIVDETKEPISFWIWFSSLFK